MNVPRLTLLAGLLLLAFASLGFYGNFVQWRDAIQTDARIISAQEQWLRRAPGNINLELEYSVKGRIYRGQASVAPYRLKDGKANEIPVYYLEDAPDRVIPVEVLQSKRRIVYAAAALGIALTVLGFVFKRRPDAPGALPAAPASPSAGATFGPPAARQ